MGIREFKSIRTLNRRPAESPKPFGPHPPWLADLVLRLLGLKGSTVGGVTVRAVVFTVVIRCLGISHDQKLLDVALQEKETEKRHGWVHCPRAQVDFFPLCQLKRLGFNIWNQYFKSKLFIAPGLAERWWNLIISHRQDKAAQTGRVSSCSPTHTHTLSQVS